MSTSFKNRIALNFTLSTALLTAIIFLVIYYIVSLTVSNRLEQELTYEADKHYYEVGIKNATPYIADRIEWMERDHQEVEVNPVFVEVTDSAGKILDKSPNLRHNVLIPDFSKGDKVIFQSRLMGRLIAQTQVALKENNKLAGYLVVAIPIGESEKVLYNLKSVLLITFPVVLLILFFVTRFIAGKSIKPVLTVIEIAEKITNENLTARIPLPASKDELRKLVVTINDLMDRIENAVEREKQFTSDASHELRTPLAVIKGTLEVLIRKPRTSAEYVEKVSFCIAEVNRISYLVEQLLLLARYESQKNAMEHQKINFSDLTDSVLQRQQQQIMNKGLSVELNADENLNVYMNPYLFDIVIENIISNAVKYSVQNGRINISVKIQDSKLTYSVSDNGIGIAPKEIAKILEPFYRSEPLLHPEIKGNGLGLSIVKRMCEILMINFSIQSESGKGTTVILKSN